MKAQDMMSQDNNRQNAIDKLVAFCVAEGYDYVFTDKEFRVKLPDAEPVPVVPIATPKHSQRKKFDFLEPDPNGVDEIFPKAEGDLNLPDELPPTETPLDEGEPPHGDDEA
jgi:hypothetical protein